MLIVPKSRTEFWICKEPWCFCIALGEGKINSSGQEKNQKARGRDERTSISGFMTRDQL